jgi:hypothetical protein
MRFLSFFNDGSEGETSVPKFNEMMFKDLVLQHGGFTQWLKLRC